MKRLFKIILALVFIYVVFWGGVAAFFTYGDRYKPELEAKLSEVFKRSVSIGEVTTLWHGFAPALQLQNLNIEGDIENQPALEIESLSATVDPLSVLRFWPVFTEFDVAKPVLEIVTLDGQDIQIAGLRLNSQRGDKELTQKVISWLADQQGAGWQGGEIVWRRDVDDTQRFKNISMSFKRDEQYRKLQTEITTSKGVLAFIATANGDLMNDSNWDASFEVLGDEGARLVEPDDFSIKVNEGQGRLLLKTIDVARIRDFVKLTGLVSSTGWLLDAKLNGRLHDVHFDFSGPFLEMDNWNLKASASDIGFRAVGRAPAMNNLSGELDASIDGGTFNFATRDAEFNWQRWYEKGFPIKRAMGEFSWKLDEDGGAQISLKNGDFEDVHSKVKNINAELSLNPSVRKVSSFGELFRLDSVTDLRFNDGDLVGPQDASLSQAPIYIDVTAEFAMTDLGSIASYLPKGKKLDKFRAWSSDAFRSGKVSKGIIHYQGDATIDAIRSGKASLEGSADFDGVVVDYAPDFNWPAATKGQGVISIKNDLLSINPNQVWLNGDPVADAAIQISSLFERSRLLSIEGKTSTSLIKAVDFIFKGPLIKPENQLGELPVKPKSGSADIAFDVEIPLRKIPETKARGVVSIRDGLGVLPGDVELSKLNASINFTEKSVTSDNIVADFLGGKASAKLETLKQAQPPIMKLNVAGVAHTQALEPWVGEHLLTWFDGEAPWQGGVLIDGGNVEITGTSDLVGIEVSAPAPLEKDRSEQASLEFAMAVGGEVAQQSMSINYRDILQARFKANRASDSPNSPSLLDNALISVGGDSAAPLKSGVNFLIEEDSIDLDKWLSAVVELASFKPKVASNNTQFLDSMRSINISAKDPFLLGCYIGPININAVSVDGLYWIGTFDGENADGTMQLQPRDELGHYGFKLAYLNLVEPPEENKDKPIAPIDYSLVPKNFPSISVDIDNFRLAGKNLGHLSLSGKPDGDEWAIDKFNLVHNGIKTTAVGGWKNNQQDGSVSKFEFSTVIDEAEGALTEMDFDGLIKKGMGSIKGNLSWLGAPHEFEYARLSGQFEAFIKDGELVKVEPGGGKLLGLLNFNAIARRLVFDFRDVFASGLIFDRMRYSAVVAEGEVILRDAFILAPAVFVRMEGKLDLGKELIDMEVHVSPELGGNLALLSALANPAAGAVVFLTQSIFKDEMRKSSFKSYRALGTWKDFEMVEIKSGEALDLIAKDDDATSSEPEIELEEVPLPVRSILDLEKIEASPIP